MNPKEKQQAEQNQRMDETFTSYKKEEGEETPPTPPEGAEEGEEETPPTPPAGDDEGEEGEAPESEGSAEEDTLAWLEGRQEQEEGGEEGEEPEGGEEPPQEPVGEEGDEGEPSGEELFSIDNDEFEEITTSPESLQKYAQKIYSSALKESKAQIEELREGFQQELANAKEEILKNIPDVVQKSASRAQATQQLVSDFYGNYPDLKDRKQYVRDMIKTVQSNNSDWSAQQVLGEVAKRAQRDFGITKKAEQREQQRKPNPKFAGAGGRRAPSGQQDGRSTQQRLIDDTIS